MPPGCPGPLPFPLAAGCGALQMFWRSTAGSGRQVIPPPQVSHQADALPGCRTKAPKMHAPPDFICCHHSRWVLSPTLSSFFPPGCSSVPPSAHSRSAGQNAEGLITVCRGSWRQPRARVLLLGWHRRLISQAARHLQVHFLLPPLAPLPVPTSLSNQGCFLQVLLIKRK